MPQLQCTPISLARKRGFLEFWLHHQDGCLENVNEGMFRQTTMASTPCSWPKATSRLLSYLGFWYNHRHV